MSGSSRRIRWRSSPCPSVQSLWFATQFPGGASRLAALLLAQILPVSSLVAPCDPGAVRGTYATIHWDGTLAAGFLPADVALQVFVDLEPDLFRLPNFFFSLEIASGRQIEHGQVVVRLARSRVGGDRQFVLAFGIGEPPAAEVGRAERHRHEVGDCGFDCQIVAAVTRLLERYECGLQLAEKQLLRLRRAFASRPLLCLLDRELVFEDA